MKIVEATFVIPLTIIILVSIIGLMMNFYGDLARQVDGHVEMREKVYETHHVW